MKRLVLALLLGCLAVAAVGCTGSSPSTPVAPPKPIPIEFETLFQGCLDLPSPYPPSPPPVAEVIENQADFEAIWTAYEIPEPVPTVDFSARTVLASHGPMRCASCGSLEVTSIVQTGDCTNVRLEWVGQCGDCLEAWKWPVHIISIPKTGTPICFDDECVSPTLKCAEGSPC